MAILIWASASTKELQSIAAGMQPRLHSIHCQQHARNAMLATRQPTGSSQQPDGLSINVISTRQRRECHQWMTKTLQHSNQTPHSDW
jgi:hypothetical protein